MSVVKLSAMHINTGGNPGQITGTMVGNPASGLRPALINTNVGNARYTNIPVPNIVVDTTIASGAKMAAIWENAAYKFQQRQEDSQARAVVLKARQEYSKTLYGDAENPGYYSQKGGLAVDSYGAFEGSLRNITNDLMEGLSPGVLAKAAVKLKENENVFLTRGAQHKIHQQSVYEQNIFKAQLTSIKRDAVTSSSNPNHFLEGKGRAIDELSRQFKGRPEAFEVVKQAFNTDLYKEVITAQVDMGRFDLAENYLAMAKLEKIDSTVLADRQNFIERRKISSVNSKITAANNQRRLQKLEAEKQANTIIGQVLQSDDVSKFNAITDYDLQAKSKKTYAVLKDVITDQGDMFSMRLNREAYVNNPNSIMDPEDRYRVSFKDRGEFYREIISDKTKNISDVKHQADDWIDGWLVSASVGIGGKYDQKAAKLTEALLSNKLSGAIRDAKKENRNPQEALYQAQMDIMANPDPYFKIGDGFAYTHTLDPISVLPAGEMPMMDAEVISRNPGQYDHPLGGVNISYKKTQMRIFQEYGLEDMLGNDYTAEELPGVLFALLPDSNARNRLLRDLVELEEHNMYYMNKVMRAEDAGVKTLGADDFSGQKQAPKAPK